MKLKKEFELIDRRDSMHMSFADSEYKSDQSTLNAYHQERNKVALQEVEEMLKQPCSSEQMLLEIQHRLSE